MSISETGESGARGVLKVVAPYARIQVMNARFDVVADEYAQLQRSLEPGIYKVRAGAGYASEERLVSIEPGTRVREKFDRPLFASAVPLYTRERGLHTRAAEHQSRMVHTRLGEGSFLFVFCSNRSLFYSTHSTSEPANKEVSAGHLFTGLSILKGDQQIAALDQLGVSEGGIYGWAAAGIAVDPGSYTLRLQIETGESIDQQLMVAPHCQSQVFLQQRYADRVERQRGAHDPMQRYPVWAKLQRGLPETSILMTQSPGAEPAGFSARGAKEWLIESARASLATGRPLFSKAYLCRLLRKYMNNPILCLLAAHLLLDCGGNVTLLRETVENLRGLVGEDDPDIEALALEVEIRSPTFQFIRPPMLLRSWRTALQASVTMPDLIPANAPVSRLSGKLLCQEPWLQIIGGSDALTAATDSELRESLNQQLNALRKQESARINESRNIEAGQEEMGQHGQNQSRDTSYFRARIDSPSGVSTDGIVPLQRGWIEELGFFPTKEEMERLVQTLGIPWARLEELISERP
jgi:hypothetical protein